ncbi:F420-dependent oxidoreductase-like protein [Amycolatopsis bartoniae]|uniref:LLM class F420-dependent oxidoreductase n=1 Tax=Amycolatopsis bartoniae TaxID=941986 RepID=A0A8H9IRJ2_9PSEU|nr:LLM class F420-dependent oxidoreductase [Amycolatopsis bartoniae]MBB2936724.1 F420-dependent oxidoreductase-like protein [Amycolatopsis bartoniae]TVT09222.1 LLM class F420-dependent oxidoreductase [Amycolatopsis bartoniae]GHF49717.1 LLM class F420-dependent oxidoreductase [Amycolatopsis bartoniae]
MARTDFRLRVLVEPRHGAGYDQLLALALAVEDAGFEAFFRSDHLLGVDPADRTYRPTDCWTTLGGLARDTRRIRLGALVGAATFRAPGLLATIVASVDQMSGGRVELGLGTGWYEREHAAFGIPFPGTGERFDRFEETLAIVTGLWRTPEGEIFSFQGKHFSLDENGAPPRTVQRPHPPVIIGGAGPKRTPAIAARFADEFNSALGVDPRERFAIFGRACEAIGRDPDEARRSVVLPVACGTTSADIERRAAVMGSDLIRDNAVIGTPAEVTERVAGLRDAGADTVYLHIYDIDDLEHIALLGAEVVPSAVSGG